MKGGNYTTFLLLVLSSGLMFNKLDRWFLGVTLGAPIGLVKVSRSAALSGQGRVISGVSLRTSPDI